MSDIFPTLAAFAAERFEGPLHARLIVQPFTAVMLALIDGLSDADQHRLPFLWPSAHQSRPDRRKRLGSTLRSLGKVLALSLALDVAHQYIALRLVDLGDALLIAGLLAMTPYAALRGAVTHFASEPRGSRRGHASPRGRALGYRGHGMTGRPD
jgi:hypothetical protein